MKNKKIIMVKKIIKIIGIVFFSALLIGTIYVVGSIIGWIRSENPDVPSESLEEWAAQFDSIALPSEVEVISFGYTDEHHFTNGSSEDRTYGYYWLLKTDLAEDELIASFVPYVDKANEETIGYLSQILHESVSTNGAEDLNFIIEALNESVSQLSRDELFDNAYYVVYILKPGRWMGVN